MSTIRPLFAPLDPYLSRYLIPIRPAFDPNLTPSLTPIRPLSQDSSAEKALKLIDFGLSKNYFPGEVMRQVVGSAYYTAPEVRACTGVGALSSQYTGLI